MGAGSLGVGAPAVATTDEHPHQGRRCCADILEGSGVAATDSRGRGGHPSRGGHHATVKASPTNGVTGRGGTRSRTVDHDTFCFEAREINALVAGWRKRANRARELKNRRRSAALGGAKSAGAEGQFLTERAQNGAASVVVVARGTPPSRRAQQPRRGDQRRRRHNRRGGEQQHTGQASPQTATSAART